jgi:hypothetical protein
MGKQKAFLPTILRTATTIYSPRNGNNHALQSKGKKFAKKFGIALIKTFITLCLFFRPMDEELPFRYLWNDDSSLAEDTDTAAATASTAANATAADADSPGSSLATCSSPLQDSTNTQVMNSINTSLPDLGEMYKKCRAAKEISLTMNVTASSKSPDGTVNYAQSSPPALALVVFKRKMILMFSKRTMALARRPADKKLSRYQFLLTRQHCCALPVNTNTRY